MENEKKEEKKFVVVTEPVLLKVVGCKRLLEEVIDELSIEDPDPEKAKAILEDVHPE